MVKEDDDDDDDGAVVSMTVTGGESGSSVGSASVGGVTVDAVEVAAGKVDFGVALFLGGMAEKQRWMCERRREIRKSGNWKLECKQKNWNDEKRKKEKPEKKTPVYIPDAFTIKKIGIEENTVTPVFLYVACRNPDCRTLGGSNVQEK